MPQEAGSKAKGPSGQSARSHLRNVVFCIGIALARARRFTMPAFVVLLAVLALGIPRLLAVGRSLVSLKLPSCRPS